MTPQGKKVMKRRNKGGRGEQIRRMEMQSKKVKREKKPRKTLVWSFKMESKCVIVYSGNLISQTLRGETNLRYSFSFSLCSSQTQKNGDNSVTLATNSAYVQREAADGGGRREVERD